MQTKLLKIGLILFLVIGLSGCAETVYLITDHGIESTTVMRDIWFSIRWVLGVISAFFGISIMFLLLIGLIFPSNDDIPTPMGVWAFLFGCLIVGYFSFAGFGDTVLQSEFTNDPKLVAANQKYQEMVKLGLNLQEYQQRQQLGADRYELKVQIRKAQTSINSLKQDRDQKVLPLKQNYSQMYNQYYPQLAQQLPGTGIRNHEELLKNCEQYLELCSSLNRVAKLQYYIGKLDDKLKQIGANIIKLDDNVFDMERTFEVSQIFSDEELEGVERLIEETKGKIDSQVPPPEKQDVAGLEKQIFNDILRS